MQKHCGKTLNYLIAAIGVVGLISIMRMPYAFAEIKHKSHHHSHHSLHHSIASDTSLAWQNFNFNYSGDVSGLLSRLKVYDSQLQVFPATGEMQQVMINLDLTNTSITNIINLVRMQSSGRVEIIYNSKADVIHLNYVDKINLGRDAVLESLKWQRGEDPKPILKNDGVVRFPYGEYQPVIICQPLNLCDVELEAGEKIEGIVIGDSVRWNQGDQGIPVVYSGSANSLTPHLVLKPSEDGLETTLLVTTSRRTYMLKLRSSNSGYVARAGFYYPHELIETFATNKEQLRDLSQVPRSSSAATQMPLLDLAKLNYHYTLSGKNYSWKPLRVFDDGISVYIQFPEGISSRSLPGICLVPEGGGSGCEMVNFRFNQHFYIIDKLFNEAKLINGFGDGMEIITISHDHPGFWARLFGSHDG